jgi:uncharacterized FlaG/YvyC family protein
MKHKNTWSTFIAVMAIAFAFIFLAKQQEALKSSEMTNSTSTTLEAKQVPSEASSTTTTLNPQRTTSSSTIYEFLESADGKAKWQVNKSSDGRVIAISGGLIPANSKSPDEALKFARKIAEKVGVPGEQIVASPVVLETTAVSTATQFDQEVAGYPVFGAFMKIFTRIPGGEVYYIANETRNVGEPILSTNYSFSDSQEIVRRKYSDRTGLVFENQPEKPVIYSTVIGQSELAWEAVIKISGPLYERRHLLVSAVSGKILKDTSLIQN